METAQKKADEGKSDRLEIRIHPQLKKALRDYCLKNLESTTEAVTNAIKNYIKFNKDK